MFVTPAKCLLCNYKALLSQLDSSRGKTGNVQQKSEARYIVERSYRNAIRHIMTIAVAHYQFDKPDPRVKILIKLQ